MVVQGMRRACVILLLACLAGCALAQAVPRPAPDVRIAVQEDQGYLITTPIYKARVGPDGNLHSLQVNGVEFLDDKVTGSSGASFFVERAIPLPTITVQDQTLTATDGTYSARLLFDEGSLTVVLRQTSGKGAAYVAICAPQTAFVENLQSGSAAAVPADYTWSDVRISVPTGEFVRLNGGSRIWGRALGRQVWERSNIAPNKDYTLYIIPGKGAPKTPALMQLTSLTATVNAPDNLVAAGTPAEVQFRFENNSTQRIEAEIALRAESALGTVLKEEKQALACDPRQQAVISWSVTPTAPDFYQVSGIVELNGSAKRARTVFGYDAANIRPPVQRPEDFTEYWQRLVGQAKTSKVTLTRLEDPARSTGTVKVYRVGMEVDGITCFGWLAVPKFPGRYPGLIYLSSERIRYMNPNAPLADCGFVVLTLEPTGQTIDGSLKPLIQRVMTTLTDPAANGLRNVMIRHLQSVTALSAVPEVDPGRIAVTGAGLGGAMALMLAAVDDRIQAVAPDVPTMCAIEWGADAPAWPYSEITEYVRKTTEPRETVLQTLRYFDVANFAELITCPVLMSAGLYDQYARPTPIYGVFNRLPAPRALKLYPAAHDGGGSLHWEEKMRWLVKVLGTPGPPAKPDALPPHEAAQP